MRKGFPWLILLAVLGVGIYFKDEIIGFLSKNVSAKVADKLSNNSAPAPKE